MMWDGVEIRVCGGDFGGIGEEEQFGEKISSQIATQISALPPYLIQSMRSNQRTQVSYENKI